MAIDRSHFAKSDIGRKRPHNEDCYVADSSTGLYVVCDGMGGGNAGEVASRMAIETILAHINSAEKHCAAATTVDDPNVTRATNRLAQAIHAANAAVFRASRDHPKYAGMGTTVAAVRLWGHTMSIAHVGDSRVYLIRDGIMQALTIDHSWVAEQVARGYMTEDEAEHSPRRNIVTRALGIERTVDIDLSELPILSGDLVLLCSDGLTRGVPYTEMLRTLRQEGDLGEKTDRLIALANDAGGEDNITVMLVAVEEGAGGRLWQRIKQRWFSKAS